ELRARARTGIGNPGVVLVDGQLAGLWRPEKKGKRLLVKIEPITDAPRGAADGIAAEAAIVAVRRGCLAADVTWA
ncbi:MAG TPA: crosslink repair DNA glycosylase YcaQ family protein, partial [Solirubrobacteraceae bacterium]